MKLVSILLVLFIYSFSVPALALSTIGDKKVSESFTSSDLVESLWQDFLNEELDPVVFYSSVKVLRLKELSISNQLRILKITNTLENTKLFSLLDLNNSTVLTDAEALKLASEWIFVGQLIGEVSKGNLVKITNAKNYLKKLSKFTSKTKKEVMDIFYHSPDYAHYNNGEFKDTLKLFLFCRKDRHYPCLFMMRDIFDNEVQNDDGSLWSLPALAHSRRELPYNITNGYTPSGVHTINSVMPEANRVQAFGQWRRVILNWIPKTNKQVNTLQFLPKSAHAKNWWKQASVARDIGRKWLRIHGTGNRNTNRSSKFYPHYATSGCISTREMKYDGVVYKDQRIILDVMMESMQLAPVFTNEVSIKGVLYVVELDDKKEKVTAKSLKEYGIE